MDVLKNQEKFDKLIFIPKNIEHLKIEENFILFENFDGTKKTSFSSNSSEINHINILSNYAYLTSGCFSYFNSIKEVEFGPTTKLYFIPENAFLRCIKLQKIVIPFSCRIIGKKAFKDCINLQTVLFGMIDKSTDKKFELDLIEDEAFYNCSSLINIIIPPTISKIGKAAFMNCDKLKRIEFGVKYITSNNKACIYINKSQEKLKMIQDNAFKNCSSLVSFRVPRTCTIIGKSAFMNCTSLFEIAFLQTKLNSIQFRSFFNCTSLKCFQLDVLYDKEEIEKLYNFSIGFESFMNCSSLKKIFINNKFNDTISIEQNPLEFTESSIKKHAFCNCSSLKIVYLFIPYFGKIEQKAFLNCSSLHKIEVNSLFYQPNFNKKINLSSFIGCPKAIKIVLFKNNQKVGVIDQKNMNPITCTSKRLFRNHLSSLNKSFLSFVLSKNKKISNKRCSVENKPNQSKKNINKSPLQFIYKYNDVQYYFSISESKRKSGFDVNPDDVTEYNYNIPVLRPPLNI